jgi:hypothetical protein
MIGHEVNSLLELVGYLTCDFFSAMKSKCESIGKTNWDFFVTESYFKLVCSIVDWLRFFERLVFGERFFVLLVVSSVC